MPKQEYRFPWRGSNRFTLLVDGEAFYPRMLEAIRGAESHVLLEMYLVESGRVMDSFIEALSSAAERADVCLLLDDFGAKGLGQEERRHLHRAGVHLIFYNPLHYGRLRRNLLRDHRKILVVDGRLAWVGGFGIADEFQPQGQPGFAWHDVAVEVAGGCVADWQALFLENWRRWSGTGLQFPLTPVMEDNQWPGRVTVGEGHRQAEMQRSLIARVRRARSRVWIASAYFVPSRKVRRLLRHAAHRGVDVRLLLPGRHTDHPAIRHASRRFYLRLLRSGVRIFEYQPRFIHAKVTLCDDWISIGSSNIDRWNLRWNLEANQEVEASGFADQVAGLLEGDFRQSREYSLEQWRQRPWDRRLREWFWGRVDRWLERHSRRR